MTKLQRATLVNNHKEVMKLTKRVEVLEAALKPFAACESTLFKNMDPAKVYLWKPSQTSQEIPGISIQNILDAKAALTETPNE